MIRELDVAKKAIKEINQRHEVEKTKKELNKYLSAAKAKPIDITYNGFKYKAKLVTVKSKRQLDEEKVKKLLSELFQPNMVNKVYEDLLKPEKVSTRLLTSVEEEPFEDFEDDEDFLKKLLFFRNE
jgi:hypothetical protein